MYIFRLNVIVYLIVYHGTLNKLQYSLNITFICTEICICIQIFFLIKQINVILPINVFNRAMSFILFFNEKYCTLHFLKREVSHDFVFISFLNNKDPKSRLLTSKLIAFLMNFSQPSLIWAFHR